MPRLLLSEHEDLLSRFRPHPASYSSRYARDLLWALYGAVGWWAWSSSGWGDWVGLVVFLVLGAVHGVLVLLLGRPGWVRGFVWAALAGAAAGAAAAGAVPASWGTFAASTWPLGALAAVLSLVASEFDRLRRVHDLTSERLVVRTGVGRLYEESLPLDQVNGVQASQGALGQLFGYGQIHLALAPRPGQRRKKGAAPEAGRMVLKGVPQWEQVKHHIEVALQERKIPSKQRERRIEERRLREAMGALAAWARREGA